MEFTSKGACVSDLGEVVIPEHTSLENCLGWEEEGVNDLKVTFLAGSQLCLFRLFFSFVPFTAFSRTIPQPVLSLILNLKPQNSGNEFY